MCSGADPEIEEGGGGGIHLEWRLVRRASLVHRPSRIRRLQYVAQKPENEAYSMHSLLEGSGSNFEI